MRLHPWIISALIALPLVSAPTLLCAEVITYRVEGVVSEESQIASAGSTVVGYFSYKDDLPVYLAFPGSVSYGYSSNVFPDPHPSDVYFQFYFDKIPVFSRDHYTRVLIYNDYNFNNPGIPTFDAFILYGTRLYSPEITLPLALELQLHLRDTDSSIYTSTALPPEAPHLNELEIASVITLGAVQANITSITRINNGDLNGDGFVGIDDLSILLNHWNQDVTLGDRLSGDSSSDGYVGIDDLNTVLNNWNAGTPANAAENIPEPGTACLLMVGAVAGLRRRGRQGNDSTPCVKCV